MFLEGFRPGVIRRLGFDYEAVSAREPRLLYLSISGFGQTGPLAERPAMDPVLQAFAGLTAGEQGRGRHPASRAGDSGRHVDFAVCVPGAVGGLYARRDEARGRYIDVSLLQGAAGLQSIRMIASTLEGGTVRPGGVPGGVYRTADGWMSITAIHDREWRALCAAVGLPALADDERFADPAARYRNEVELNAVLRPVLATRDSAEWSRRFTDAKILHERVNRYADFLQEPQVAATGAIAWLEPAGRAPAGAGAERAGDGCRDRWFAALDVAGLRAAHARGAERTRIQRRADRSADFGGRRDRRCSVTSTTHGPARAGPNLTSPAPHEPARSGPITGRQRHDG